MVLDKHGGNTYKYDREMLDFSSNINPLGMPEEIKTAVKSGVEFCENYPDPDSRELKEAISKKIDVPTSYICCGNGGDDLIYRTIISISPKRALVVVPIFSEYLEALELSGCEVEYYFLKEEDGFVLKNDILQQIEEANNSEKNFDMVVACTPNNPTGILIQQSLLLEIAEICKVTNAKFLLDECFMEFVKEPQYCSIINFTKQYDNLLIIKSFTKIYAMAGIRLGYLICGNYDSLEKISNCMQTWSVSTLAAKAGIAALTLEGWEKKTVSVILKERKLLMKALEENGYKTYDSDANYIFFRSRNPLLEIFLSHSIMIRSCQNYIGINKGIEEPEYYYYRIAVRSPQENSKFIDVLNRISDNDN